MALENKMKTIDTAAPLLLSNLTVQVILEKCIYAIILTVQHKSEISTTLMATVFITNTTQTPDCHLTPQSHIALMVMLLLFSLYHHMLST